MTVATNAPETQVAASIEMPAGEMLESPIVEVTRQITPRTTLVLYVRAGGRCQRRGCNVRLVEQPVSKQPGNYAERAHIVAFSTAGPRGHEGARPEDINGIDNLMLLCQPCHKEIDDFPDRYPRSLLEDMKREHEVRVETVLDLAPENSSHIISFTAPIRGFQVAIPRGDAFDATQPRHPINGNATLIDMRNMKGVEEGSAFLEVGQSMIDNEIAAAYATGGFVEAAQHVSVFAIGPIPLLVYLGSRLGDKVPADLYQRHRDTEDWCWKSESDYPTVSYEFSQIADNGINAPVGVLISLSGSIDIATLPVNVRTRHTLYEITLAEQTPSPTFLNCRRDLIAFRRTWHDVQSHIAKVHGDAHPVSIFPAIPAPIAVAIGKDRLPKARPPLHIYDNDAAKGGFTFQLGIT